MVAEPQRLVQIVGDEHDRLAQVALQADQLVLHVTPDQRIQRAERLVHQQDLRVGAERSRQTDPLLHAARELVRPHALVALQPDDVDPPGGVFQPFLLRHASDPQAVRDVLDHIAVREQSEALEHHAHPGAPQLRDLAGVHVHDVGAVDQHLTRGRIDQPVHAAHERRFATAGQPHHDGGLRSLDAQVHVVQPDRVAGSIQDLFLAHTRRDLRHHFLRTLAEDLVQVAYFDVARVGDTVLRAGVLVREHCRVLHYSRGLEVRVGSRRAP